MKTLKNLTILISILSSVLFYISCADKTAMEITLSYYAGNWYNDENGNILFTINSDGSITDNGSNKKIPASDITRNSATNYTLPDESVLIFTSANKGTFTIDEETTSNITKK